MSGSFSYHLQLFGKLRLVDQFGNEVKLPTRKALLLLAILLVDEQDRWIRSELADLIWPENGPEMARSSLRTAVRMVRKATCADAIGSEGDEIWLDRSLFGSDLGDGVGAREFLPGLSQPWVADRRRMLDQALITRLLKTAEGHLAGGEFDKVRDVLSEASRVDPEDKRVHSMRARLRSVSQDLDEKPTGAVESQPERPSLFVQVHPLVPAAEYLLATDPEQALKFLASTQEHWGSMPARFSADLHRRVLKGARSIGLERRRVEAMSIWLNALEGSLDPSNPSLRQKLSDALNEADLSNANLVAGAISIAAQQRGDLKTAYKYAQIRSKILGESREPEARPRALYQLANIERHCGLYEVARARNLDAMREFKELGRGTGVAMTHLTAATDCIWAGEYEAAADHIDSAHRHFQATGNDRVGPWVTLAEAWLEESSGNPGQGRKILMELQVDAENLHGPAFQAGVEEHLLVLDARLGQWDESAVAWAKAKRVRERAGLVPSAFERDISRASKNLVRERLGVAELRARWEESS